MAYYVYILECADKTLYTGLTNNLENRLFAHNNLKSGAQYTKTRRPVTLVYFETERSSASARKREYVLKQLSRAEKLKLVRNGKRNRA